MGHRPLEPKGERGDRRIALNAIWMGARDSSRGREQSIGGGKASSREEKRKQNQRELLRERQKGASRRL